MSETRVLLTITQRPDRGWSVAIDPEHDRGFARTDCSSLDDALRMAVPYIASACEPPLMRSLLERLASAADLAAPVGRDQEDQPI